MTTRAVGHLKVSMPAGRNYAVHIPYGTGRTLKHYIGMIETVVVIVAPFADLIDPSFQLLQKQIIKFGSHTSHFI